MKRILIFLLILTAAYGCKKNPLGLTPDGRITLTDVFQDNDKTGSYLNTCYNYIQQQGIAYDWWSFLDGFTDNAHNNDDPTENLNATDWYKGGLSPVHNPLDASRAGFSGNYYAQAWRGIRATNVFLANIDHAQVNSPVDRSRWKAEARVLRAYYYWWLIRMYGGMPIISKPLALTADFKTLKRNTFDSCVQFILADCELAIANPDLPWRITIEQDRGRMTKAIAYAIESEASLFDASPLWNPSNDLSKWKQAAQISQTALNALIAHGYALFPDYASYFLNTPDLGVNPSDKETIFQIKNSGGINQIQNLNGIPSLHGYKAGCSPSQELVDAYEMKTGIAPILGYNDSSHLSPIINPLSGYDENNPYLNRDPRFYATVLYNGAHYGLINGVDHFIESYVNGSDGISQNQREFTHNGYYLRKYVDTTLTPAQSSSASFREFRLAEIYLNLAEAENEANGPDPVAYDAVNAIRSRAGMPSLLGLTQAQFRDRVRNERRVEFAFEGERLWDVRRWKIINQTDHLTTGMKWIKNPNGSFSDQRIVVDTRLTYFDRFLIFPVPQNEISDLPDFQQNPGW